MTLGILVALRLSPDQANDLDKFCQANGNLSRAAGARLLLHRQVKYEKWRSARASRNLPPYPLTRVPRSLPDERFEEAAKAVDRLRQANPAASDEDVSRMLVGSWNPLRPLLENAKKLVGRISRERANAQLEADMNADIEARRAQVPAPATDAPPEEDA